MTGNLLASILAVFGVEYIVRMPFVRVAKNLLAVAHKSTRILRSRRVSDHWKERVLIVYALELMKSSLYLTALLAGLFVCLGAAGLLFDVLFNPDPTTIDTLADPVGWVWMTVAALLYVYLRKFFTAVAGKTSDCTRSDRKA